MFEMLDAARVGAMIVAAQGAHRRPADYVESAPSEYAGAITVMLQERAPKNVSL